MAKKERIKSVTLDKKDYDLKEITESIAKVQLINENKANIYGFDTRRAIEEQYDQKFKKTYNRDLTDKERVIKDDYVLDFQNRLELTSYVIEEFKQTEKGKKQLEVIRNEKDIKKRERGDADGKRQEEEREKRFLEARQKALLQQRKDEAKRKKKQEAEEKAQAEQRNKEKLENHLQTLNYKSGIDPLLSPYHIKTDPLEGYRTTTNLRPPRDNPLATIANKGMSTMDQLIHRGPDLLANMFDIFFVWSPLNNGEHKMFGDFDEKFVPPWATSYEKYLLNHKGFAVRAGSVKIPAVYNNDFSIPFLEEEIYKVGSTKTVDNQSEFTFTLDTNLVWLDQIQLLAGRLNVLNDYIYDPSKAKSQEKHSFIGSLKARSGELNTMTSDIYRRLFLTVAQSWSSAGILSTGQEEHAIKQFELSLIVKLQHLSSFINAPIQSRVLPYYVFENIKILGTGDSINYTNKGAATQTITVPFIYRRLYQVAPSLGSHKNGKPTLTWERTFNMANPVDDEKDKTKMIPFYKQYIINEQYIEPTGTIQEQVELTGDNR